VGLRIPIKDNKKRAVKSGKQRRVEIVERRKARDSIVDFVDPRSLPENWPKGAIAANFAGLGLLHPFALAPYFYVDKPFTCRDCGVDQVWRATQQKWFYEVAKGDLSATAVRCLPCRRKERERKAKARADSLLGSLAKIERMKKKVS
jgi:Probable zinc-ribbon domain